MSTVEWIDNVTQPYNGTAFDHKQNEVVSHATTRLNLENIMLNKRSQSQKSAYRMMPFTENVRNKQIYRNRK